MKNLNNQFFSIHLFFATNYQDFFYCLVCIDDLDAACRPGTARRERGDGATAGAAADSVSSPGCPPFCYSRHNAVCRLLADAGKFCVMSVEYRLAPEHKFPSSVEDAWEVIKIVFAILGLILIFSIIKQIWSDRVYRDNDADEGSDY